MRITELPTNININRKSGFEIAIGAEAAEIVTLKFVWKSSHTRIISAKGGHSIELKE
jgi:hypothetical protein